MKLCLDPGHSGPIEPGACAAGLTEAALNLSLALRIGGLLLNKGYEVLYTREGDIEDTGLAFRASIANEAQADLFISLHCNAAENSSVHGIETFYHTGAQEGHKLAEKVQENLAALEYTLNRGIKEADFAVLRLTNMPAILIECGFITSDIDRKYLTSRNCQEHLSTAIMLGIEGYWQ